MIGHYCCCAHYGRGGGPIHQKHFQCAGTEQDLSQCDSFNDTTPRTHDEDVGIECYGMYIHHLYVNMELSLLL